MRNMSFMLTKQQIYNKTKTVTRRLGWGFLKPGDIVMACEKCQGLKKGESIVHISPIRILNTGWIALDRVTPPEVAREGFPDMTTAEFVEMFCNKMGCGPHTLVNRIEFEYCNVADAITRNGKGE